MSKKRIELTDLFENQQYRKWHLRLHTTFCPLEDQGYGKGWDHAWFSYVAESIGGNLINIEYTDDGVNYSSIVVEVDEEEFSLFLLSLE